MSATPCARRLTALAFSVVAICSMAPVSVSAQTVEESATDRQARDHFEQGVALFQEEAFDAALSEFRSSYELRPNPGVLYNIGVVERALHRYADAIVTLRRYLSETEDEPATQERRAAVQSIVEDMEALLGSVVIATQPEGADLFIDGELRGQTPLDSALRLEAGEHQLELRLDGYRTRVENLEVRSQTVLRRQIELEALPPPPIYRRWWFWTAIGVVIAGATVAAVVPFTVRPDEATFGPIQVTRE